MHRRRCVGVAFAVRQRARLATDQRRDIGGCYDGARGGIPQYAGKPFGGLGWIEGDTNPAGGQAPDRAGQPEHRIRCDHRDRPAARRQHRDSARGAFGQHQKFTTGHPHPGVDNRDRVRLVHRRGPNPVQPRAFAEIGGERQELLAMRVGEAERNRRRALPMHYTATVRTEGCTVCTKKGILHLPTFPADFTLLRGKDALTVYTFETGVAQHPFCAHCGMHAFYIPRSQPDKVTVNARCLDGIDGPSLKPTRFFDGRHWEDAQRNRIATGGHVSPVGFAGAETLKRIFEGSEP